MEYKKSYKGFIAWMIGFFAVMFALPLLPVEDEGTMVRIVCSVCMLAIALLTYIIYFTGYVYWYNGVTYEDALRAGDARRKAYALAHARRIGAFAAGLVVFSLLMHLLGASFWIDFAVATLGLIGVVISTIGIRL